MTTPAKKRVATRKRRSGVAEKRLGDRRPPARRPVVGWREWVHLPDLASPSIRAKLDTGARSSSLHATDVEPFRRRGESWVRFRIRPRSEAGSRSVRCEAPSLGVRRVRSSTGVVQRRHVVRTRLRLGEVAWEIEVTLSDRAEMGYEMLIGRTALHRRFVIDPARSYVLGRPARSARKKPKKTQDEEE